MKPNNKDNEQITKSDIQQELDRQCIKDLEFLMQTPEGRRFFSWVILIAGYNSAGIRGNSQDFYINGRRSVAADVIAACNALGLPGMKLRHQAEEEYFQLQIGIEKNLKHKRGDKDVWQV